MRRLTVFLVVLVTGMAVAGDPAYAKGPVEATIGDGSRVVRLAMDDGAQGRKLQDLAEVTGFWSVGAEVRSVREPAVRGPGYEVRYVVSTDQRNRPVVFRQVLYPGTSAGSLIYTPPGQTVYGVAALSRWAESPVNLRLFLRGYGIRVPETAVVRPSPTATASVGPVATAAASGGQDGSRALLIGVPAVALALLLGAGALLVRRRRRA